MFFFFKQKTAYEMRISDWSSDVCSSDLTAAQPGNKWAFPLQTTIDGRAAFAICDKLTTVAVSRLIPAKGGIMRMPVGEFDDMLRLVLAWLPVTSTPPSPPQGAPPPPTASGAYGRSSEEGRVRNEGFSKCRSWCGTLR